MIEVDIQRQHTGPTPTDSDFQRWVEAALAGRCQDAQLCIRLVDPEESQTLNATYRGKDAPTNVLSFPFEPPPGLPAQHFLGDMAICTAVVAREAHEQRKTLQDHYAHIVVHGVLHLLGFDHINETDANEMEALEVAILAGLTIADPYLQGE